MATLKQQIDSLYELGKQIKSFNPAITQIYFEIKDANPFEMEALAKEVRREVSDAHIFGKDVLRVMGQPYGEYDITIWVYSIPVNITPTLKWCLLDENIGALQPPETTPLSPFTTEMTDEEENEILHDIIGGTKY